MSEQAKHLVALRAFANEMIQAALDGGDMDGGSIQEAAVKHGLLAIKQMAAPCRGPAKHCRCAWSTDFPADCYQPTAAMTEAVADVGAELRVQVCELGMRGKAYDAPDTCRAYTYAAQPGNDIAYSLGSCLRAAHCDGGGDFIDFGLAILRRLQDRGFGVFQIHAPTRGKESE